MRTLTSLRPFNSCHLLGRDLLRLFRLSLGLSLMFELRQPPQVGDSGAIWVLDPDPVWVDVVFSQLDAWLNLAIDPLWHTFF